MGERQYTRLGRSRRRAIFALVTSGRTSLWLAKDHLLQIDTMGYTESYKRFYFRDIQALVLCQTNVWLYQAVVLASLASLCALIAIFGGGPVVAWIFGILAGIFGFLLMIDLIGGPTSKAYLRTAVQTEKLISLDRLRRAQRVFEKLRVQILAAQGQPASTGPTTGLSEELMPPVISGQPVAPPDAVAEKIKPSSGEMA